MAANSTTTIQYIYQEPKTTGDLSLNADPKIVENEGDTNWTATLKNTGTSDMKEIKINASEAWSITNGASSGLVFPSTVFVTVDGESKQTFSTNGSDFVNGLPLTDIVIPAGKEAKIEFATQARGKPLEVLQAGIEISGNLIDGEGKDTTLKGSNVVRVDDPEAPTIEGEGDAGFINIYKTLDFGTVTYSPAAQSKVLGEISQSPYLRFYNMNDSKSQWSLHAKLDTFKTTTNKTLPTTTSILIEDFQLYDLNDYNTIDENRSSPDGTVRLEVPSDGTTVEVTNGLNKGYYEIRALADRVWLNIPPFAGQTGEAYSSTLTWTLATGP